MRRILFLFVYLEKLIIVSHQQLLFFFVITYVNIFGKQKRRKKKRETNREQKEILTWAERIILWVKESNRLVNYTSTILKYRPTRNY